MSHALQRLCRGLALAFLDGFWDERDLLNRTERVFGYRPKWALPLVRLLLGEFKAPPHARFDELARAIYATGVLQDEYRKQGHYPKLRRWLTPLSTMEPARRLGPSFRPLPLHTDADIAKWLGTSVSDLAWFADLNRRGSRPNISRRLRHYHYRWSSKSSGGYRLIEAPKECLRFFQRRVLHDVLERLSVAPEAHGFVPGRSIHSFAAPHVNKDVLVRLDLRDFFCGVTAPRVRAIFKLMGYPERVSALLTGLCTTSTPMDVLDLMPKSGSVSERFEVRQRLRTDHIPQGAPTSPMLSNLVAFQLDRRLGGLAQSLKVTYTRYADDLAFSSSSHLKTRIPWMLAMVGAIAEEEGFRVHHRKTRVMGRGQRQEIGGLVVNKGTNVRRNEYDRLRAILHNAIRDGLDSQNRDGHPNFREHLAGRIAWVRATHANRAKALERLLAQIA